MKGRTFLLIGVAMLAGVLIGRSCVHHPATPRATDSATSSASASKQVWTCSMHPQIRLDKPGNCPICEMPLILADAAGANADGVPSLRLSDDARAMAHVETTPVEHRTLTRQLRAVGKIQYNESSLATITARVDGYAERLFVDFTGVDIQAGDHLAEIYSPALIAAQQELLIALQGSPEGLAGAMAQSTRLKLLRWGITDAQVKTLAEKKQIADRVTLYSPISGTVIEKNITGNSAFKEGDALYRVANLDTVWAYVDVYEVDLPWIRYGQKVELTSEALPGRIVEGRVTFVQPIVDELTRTIRIPIHVENPDHALKPGMFVSASILSVLGEDGAAAPTGVEGMFSCPMHPQVLNPEPGPCPNCGMPRVAIPGARHDHADAPAVPEVPAYACAMHCEGDKTYTEPGNCPVCGMKLDLVAPKPPQTGTPLLAIPATAVLDSGTRKLVYVEREPGLFEARELVLGPRADAFYPVLKGLDEGDRVVTRGGFLVDSQFQISGHPSLFYPGGLLGDHASATNAPNEASLNPAAAGHGSH